MLRNIFCITLVFCILFSGCTLTNKGKMDVDLIINVDIAKDIIKGSIGIGLPLALEQMDKEKIQSHASQVSVATSTALNILGDVSKPINSKDMDKVLAIFDKDLSPLERYAIQSSLDLILSLVREEVKPEQFLNPDLKEILIFFLREVNSIYALYSTNSMKPLNKAKLLYQLPREKQ